MGLFSSPSSYVGIDIGTSSIKLTELENYKSQARLKTYGYANVAVNVLKSSTERNNQVIADYINQIFAKSHVQSKQVIAALPTFAVFNFIINLPPMAKRDLDAAIKWEAKKFIPVPIEEMILDWKILNKRKVKGPKTKMSELINADSAVGAGAKASPEHKSMEGGADPKKDNNDALSEIKSLAQVKEAGEAGADKSSGVPGGSSQILSAQDDRNYRILLTAAPKNLVARYIDIFKRAKLNLISLETEAFALARSLIGNDMSTVMIVDIGASSADICIIEEGVPILNRGIDTGGESITKAIANSLNVTPERAEQFKRDFGLATSGIGFKNVPEAIQKSLNTIINEIQYVFELYQKQGQVKIEKIILTGGSAFLPSLPDYISNLLSLPVIIGDPWDRVVYPLDLKSVLQEIGPIMAVSIGLAMRDI